MTASEFLREAEIRIGSRNEMPAIEIGIYPTKKKGIGKIENAAQGEFLEYALRNIPSVQFK